MAQREPRMPHPDRRAVLAGRGATVGVPRLARAATICNGAGREAPVSRQGSSAFSRPTRRRRSYVNLDEPAASLDFGNQGKVMSPPTRRGRSRRAFHHPWPNQALRYADQALLLRGGQKLASGKASDLLTPEQLAPLYGVAIETVRGAPGRPRRPLRHLGGERTAAQPGFDRGVAAGVREAGRRRHEGLLGPRRRRRHRQTLAGNRPTPRTFPPRAVA